MGKTIKNGEFGLFPYHLQEISGLSYERKVYSTCLVKFLQQNTGDIPC